MSQGTIKAGLFGLAFVGGAATFGILGMYRASGSFQVAPNREGPVVVKTAPSDGPAPAAPELPLNLNPRLRERLTIARTIRDEAFRLNRGVDNVESFLIWQQRFLDLIVKELAADPKNSELIKILEANVKELVDLEQSYREATKAGFHTELTVMTIRFYRLDAEEKLDRARAHRDRG